MAQINNVPLTAQRRAEIEASIKRVEDLIAKKGYANRAGNSLQYLKRVLAQGYEEKVSF